MFRKVLIVANAETFTIKGLEMKLQGIAVSSEFSEMKIRELEGKIEETDLILLYTDVNVGEASETLVYMKDHCMEKGKEIIVIGTKLEYDVVKTYVTADLIIEFFERPLEMEKLLSCVDDYMSEEFQTSKKKSILIVDDDVQYMSMIKDWLQDGYRVSMANSGMHAITWMANNHADLVLLDYEMPVTPGPKVLEMMKSEPETAGIPVMFLTGNNDKESIVKVLSLKPVDYLLKTIDKKGLNEKINNYFMTQKAK